MKSVDSKVIIKTIYAEGMLRTGENSLDTLGKHLLCSPAYYVCRHSTAPPEIRGDLSHPACQNAPWTDDFADIEGLDRPTPSHQTRAKLHWDETYLYTAAKLEDPHVWARLNEHDLLGREQLGRGRLVDRQLGGEAVLSPSLAGR